MDIIKDWTVLLKGIKAYPFLIKVIAITVSIGATFFLGKAFGAFMYYVQMNHFN